MDLLAIQGLASSLKTAIDVSKALFDLKLSADVQTKVIDLQSAILAAQNSALAATAAQFELQERVKELEAQLRAVEDWNATKARYLLVAPWRGAAQVYALRRAESRGEEPHFLCTNCFHQRKPVILIPTPVQHMAIMQCPACKALIQTGYTAVGPAKYAEEFLKAE
jgi:hypothetical protein